MRLALLVLLGTLILPTAVAPGLGPDDLPDPGQKGVWVICAEPEPRPCVQEAMSGTFDTTRGLGETLKDPDNRPELPQ